MSDAAVDILIRFQDKGSARLREIMDRLNQGGPVAARLGAAGAAALAAIERHGANAARVLGGLGTAAAAVGGKLNHALGLAVGRLVSLAKWLALAGAAFAGWQIGQGIRLNQQLEQSNVALTVLLRSQARANLLQRETLSFAARTPFRYEELDETVRMLEAFNMESSSWLSTVGDLAAGVGRPIQEVARALAYLSTGRTGEAAESLARMGVNLRAIRGLQWGGQGELLTPKDEAMRVVKGFLDERYGGMMERQSKTFAGAASTMMDNIALLRAEVTKPLFERLRDRLIQLNAAWDRLSQSPGVQRFIQAVQGSLVKALEYVERLAQRFATVFEQTGSPGAALLAGLNQVWEDAKPLAAKFIAWLANALVEALKLAFKGFMGASLGTQVALGGLGALSLAGHVASLASLLKTAGPKIASFATGAWGLGKAGAAAIPGWLGAGGLAATLAATLTPLAAAYVVGKIGQWGVGAWGDASSRAIEQGNAGWGTTLLSRLTGLGIDVDRANAGAAAGREAQAAFQNRTAFDAGRETEFVAIIERNVAAYRQIVAAQKAVADSIQDTTDRIKSAGEAFLEKYRTPEEKLAERQAAAARLLDKRDVLANPESYKLDDATLKRLNEISDPAQRAMQTQVELARKARDVEQERLRVIQDLHAARLAEGDAQIALLDKEKERFEAERRRTEEIRRQNASYAEQIALMSPAERARAKAVKEWVGEDYSRFGQLNESDKRRLMNDPSFKKVFEEKFQPRILAEQGIVQPAAAPERDWEAEKAAKAKAIKEQADAEATAGVAGVKAGQGEYAKQAKAVEEGMIAALAKWQKDNFKPGDKTAETKVDIGNIEILLKLDESGELTERISAAVRSAETLIVKHVMERVRLEHAANG